MITRAIRNEDRRPSEQAPLPCPLLSIVVPTKNRPHTALACIRTLLAMPDADLEIVVRDCSDGTELKEAAAELDDARLIYSHAEPTSMTENWNRAVALSNGRYVCFIGDDDGVMPWTLEILRKAVAVGPVTCLASDPLRIIYRWPDFPIEAQKAMLVFDRFDAEVKLTRQSARAALEQFLKGSREGGLPLPGIYHRILSRSVLERIRELHGAYFSTLNPDFYTYVATCGLIDEYLLVDPPMTIAGSCSISNSGRVAKNQRAFGAHIAEYGPDGAKSDPLSPPVTLTSGSLADTVIRALQVIDDESLIRLYKIDYAPRCYADLTALAPANALPLFGMFHSGTLGGVGLLDRLRASLNYSKHCAGFLARHAGFLARRIGLWQHPHDTDRHRFYDVSDIGEAVRLVEMTALTAPATVP